MVSDEVAKVLALTEAQRHELARRHQELHVLYQGGGKAAQLGLPGMTKDSNDGQRAYDAWQRLNRQAEADMWKVLTAEQQARWQKFAGQTAKR